MTDLTDPDRALQEVARLAFSDVRELFDEHGNLRAIDDLPNHLAATIASIRVVKRKTYVIQKVRFCDKAKALGMLLKHFGLVKGSRSPEWRGGTGGATRGRDGNARFG